MQARDEYSTYPSGAPNGNSMYIVIAEIEGVC